MSARVAISDAEMQKTYHWSPPAIVDRSEHLPGQMLLPGMPEAHQAVPPGGVEHGSPLFHQAHNPHVWGALVGTHNPFLHQGLHEPSDLYSGWDAEPGWDDKNEKLERKVSRHLQKVVSAGHPCIAVTGNVLHQVLHDGRLKSQFETRSSRGMLSESTRGANEYHHFGYRHHEGESEGDDYDFGGDEDPGWDHEPDHPLHARPIYGYLAHDPFRNTLSSQYGEHSLVLKKPKVWHRTTATKGDSLGRYEEMLPRPVQRADLHMASPHLSQVDEYDHPDDESLLRAKLREVGQHHLDNAPHYTEAQYHGGVTTDDVHYAVLRGRQNDPSVAQLKDHLNQKQIPWVHVGHGPAHGGTDIGDWGFGVHDHSRHEALYRHAVHYQALLVAAREGSMDVTVIAHQGPGVYLVQTRPGYGQIADTNRGLIWPEQSIASITSRGYWTPTSTVDAEAVLALVKPA